ncbi:MAG: putative IMPACT (imprinted ancient) family translation regulator [Candidatus Azotimanducaceae bacterium]
MPKQNTQIDFGDATEPEVDFVLHEKVIRDRGSLYSVSLGRVIGKEDVTLFLKQLKSKKKYLKATHNSWAARISHTGTIFEFKNDDGETGAGQVILSIMQKQNVSNCIICVTRWFGGTKLMNDRFKHLQDATKYAIQRI